MKTKLRCGVRAFYRAARGTMLFGLVGSLAGANIFARPLIGYDFNGNQTSQRNVALTAPTIVTQPRDVLLSPGGTVRFSVVASGASTYQWKLDGTNVAGATNDTLELAGLDGSLTNYGQYTLVASNSAGGVTSAPATILPDTDSDGMADAKEMQYFETLGNSSGEDFDSDGVSNYDELEYGSSPTTANVYLTNAATWFLHDLGARQTLAPRRYPDLGDMPLPFAPARIGPFLAVGLPLGMMCNPQTGRLEGEPGEVGDFSISVFCSTPFGNAASSLRLAVSEIFEFGNETAVPASLSRVVAVSAGSGYSLALLNDGKVVAWGYSSGAAVPPDLVDVVAVSAGSGGHSLALLSDGMVVGWGNNSDGQASAPPDLPDAVAIAAGGYHSLALRSDGTVVAWGYNGNGQASVPEALANVVAIAAGGYHSLALRSDGTVVAWGYNGNGQASVPEGLANVVAIAAGADHSLALRSDGTVVAWGGAPGAFVPPDLAGVVAVSAGDGHSLALRSDGTLAAWGNDQYGQATVPSSLTNVVAVAAGGNSSFAILDLPFSSGNLLIAPHFALAYSTLPFHLRVAAKGSGMTYSATGLPTGLSIDSVTGLISGTPSQTGAYDAILRSNGPMGQKEKALKLIVLAPAGKITSPAPGPLAVGKPFSYQVSTHPSATGYSASGLPAGINLNTATGLISGTPTTAGTSRASIGAETPYGQAVANFDFIVNDWRPLGGIDLNFDLGGNAYWFLQSDVIPLGSDLAARSGNTADATTSWIETTVTGPGLLTFWRKVSSESDYDFLQILVDGSEVNRWSGEQDWTQDTIAIDEGTHSVRWQYSKDGVMSGGLDAAFIAKVAFMRSGFSSWTVAPLLPENRRGPMDRNGPMNLPNFLSYSMALDPRTATPADMPALGQRGTGTMKFLFRRAKNLPDADLRIMSSTNLSAPWGAADVRSTAVLQDGGDHEKVEATIGMPQGATRFFLRLQAEQR